jgi:hypothetical protein
MGTSNIADKVVVITGASSGLGESTASFWRDTERRSSWERGVILSFLTPTALSTDPAASKPARHQKSGSRETAPYGIALSPRVSIDT